MIPEGSNYPDSLDTDDNMFVVHDSVRMRLAEDYEPGDTSIRVEGDFLVFSRIPPTGLITLTEQCSDIADRAVSFYYSSFVDAEDGTGTISGLEILPGFPDVVKPKRITNVTMNVMDRHHNSIKDALVSMQEFFGVEGTTDREPLGETMEGRINFLRNLVLTPKAWFTADRRTGNVPFEVEFEELCFRLGTDGNSGDVTFQWDFGDQTVSTISYIDVVSATSVAPDGEVNVYVRDTDGGKIRKTYHEGGLYTVKLTVSNDFGSDTVVFEDFVNARIPAPNTAIIRLVENTSNQSATAGVPPDGPFQIYPKIRSPINTLIQIEVDEGENPSTPGYSYAGEPLNNSDQPIDPIEVWTWSLSDDLSHSNNRETKASFGTGGVYDLKLRVDTGLGAYRITTYEDAFDIVENTNLWLWVHEDEDSVRAYEYGLISETFKVAATASLNVSRDHSFLEGEANAEQQIAEFRRNVGFGPRGSTPSGQGGTAMLYWATGRGAADPVSAEEIAVREYDGFSDTYVTRTSLTRQWNWAGLHGPQASYFVFGAVPSHEPNTSATNTAKQALSLNTLSITSTPLDSNNYLNGASELTQNVATFDGSGDPTYGHFSVYRTAWHGNTGYIARNDGVGPFFRLKSFYRTEGTSSSPFLNIRKLADVGGPTKLEGEMVGLSGGVYFLNNSGSVARYIPDDGVWRTGGPGVNSLLYRSLQDTTVVGFDDQSNRLLLAGDGDKRAYLSFDYSPDAFIRFNETDTTFGKLGSRPEGEQFVMGVF